MTIAQPTFWFPPDLDLEHSVATLTGPDGQQESRVTFAPGHMAALCKAMRARREALAALSVERIVDALHRASLLWMDVDSPRVSALVSAMAKRTGMSVEMVAQAVRHEMESSLGPDIFAALKNEIGDYRYLDGFSRNPHLGGETYAVGPELVGGVVSANIPALPHLTVMRSLLVKSPCVVKTSAGEPFFLPAYAQTLWETDSLVGRAVVVASFSRDDYEALDEFLHGIDFLIAYGGLEAIARLQQRKPRELRALFHGHKLGFGLVAREALDPAGFKSLARNIAYDTILFDQEACLAPHVVFVEGSFEQANRLGRAVLTQMRRLSKKYPPATKSLAHKLSIRQELDLLSLDGNDGPCKVLQAGNPEDGIVVVRKLNQFLPSPLGRFLRLSPVENLDEALPIVGSLSGLLQNAAVAAPPAKRRNLARKLAALGVARVCPPGNMGTPTMMWHHDGHPCIAAMLRFTDFEVRGRMFPPLVEQLGSRFGLRQKLEALSDNVPEDWLERAAKLVERTRAIRRSRGK